MDALLFVTGFCSLLFLLAALYFCLNYWESRVKLARRLAEITAAERQNHSSRPFAARKSFFMKLFRLRLSPFGRLGSRVLFPHTLQELDSLLERSGMSGRLAASELLGMKVMLASVGLVVGCLAFAAGIPFAQFGLLLLPGAGFFAPVIWLNQVIRKRKEAMALAVPDFMDLMGITLQAGISFDQALRQAAGIFHGPLRDEIYRLNREMELGVDRETAWMRMLERNPGTELQKIANTVLQGTSLGVPMAEVFRLQAEDSRRLRMEQSKQRAAKASPKITLVTTLVMAPAVFIMILGLLLLNVFYNPQGLGIEGLFN